MAQVILNVPQVMENHVGVKARQFACNELIRMADGYVPFRDGYLKNNVSIGIDGRHIKYHMIYAKYQWDNNFKNYSNNYTGNRGGHWTIRMMNNRGREISKSIADYIGGHL